MAHAQDETKPKTKAQELKDQGYYLLANQNSVMLYDPETCLKTTLGMYSHADQTELKDTLKTITEQVFKPKQPELYPNSLGYTHNTYKQYEATPTGDADLSLWIEFLNRLFPDKEERTAITQFLAHMFQYPEERPTFAVMLTSDSGTGKGFLYSKILRPLVMNQCSQVSTYQSFLCQHTMCMKDSLLVMLDDPKSDHPATMTKLKSRISESTFLLEEKGIDQRTISVYPRILLASNEIAPIKLEESDKRRWFAPSFIRHKESKEETAEFTKRLSESLDLDAIYNWFMGVSLDGFDPYMPPETETIRDMVDDQQSDVHLAVQEFVAENPVFQWEEILFAVNEGSSQEIKSALTVLGYALSRPTVEGKKLSIWHHCSLPKAEAKSRYTFSN